MNTLSEFRSFTSRLEDSDVLMPVLFVGHGSPMNGIEDNAFSRRWADKGKEIPTPAAVLCVSAHWFTRGTRITAMDAPPTIHDFYGFPPALSAVEYPAPGDPALAAYTAGLLESAGHAGSTGHGAAAGHPAPAAPVLDHDWGLDHGTWTITRHMYPDARIPVLQLSIDHTQPPARHLELGRELAALRRKGVLIIGSGNMVHNLRMMNWHQPGGAYDWAATAQERFSTLIREGDATALAHYDRLGPEVRLAIPTPEHYLPLLYVLGLRGADEPLAFFNDQTVMGSISMTSIQIGTAGK
jgi:4,5-DOPA dioxygenase extradiol